MSHIDVNVQADEVWKESVLVTASVQCKMQASWRRLYWSGLTT
jgi:hypothetical protein